MKNLPLARLAWILAAAVLISAAVLIAYGPPSRDRLEGTYSSVGQVRLASGEVVEVSHRILFQGRHFYAMSRQGGTILETSGSLSSGRDGYRIHVERGEALNLDGKMDDQLIFKLLYSRHPGAELRLQKIGDCLYARETFQMFCPGLIAG